MAIDFSARISENLALPYRGVQQSIKLLEEGASIPFISRYRKEMTGSLDEVQILSISDMYQALQEIEKRRESIIEAIEKQDMLSPELLKQLKEASSLVELEDLYLPYKKKRKTRAVKAREKGLEPLAKLIMKQDSVDVEFKAEEFVNDEVADADEALQGARDIIAEWISESIEARDSIRSQFERFAVIQSALVKKKEEEAQKYKDYFEWEEKANKVPSHRLLAMYRGEREGFLKLKIMPEEEYAIERLKKIFIHSRNECSRQIEMAAEDSYKRLLAPSIENEYRNQLKEKADQEAIHVFNENLRQLLLAPPLGQKNILALDPGYRTGCKVVCIDRQGNLKHNETIFPHPPQNETRQAAKKIASLVDAYGIEAIAIGNGTASRETEHFIRNKVMFKKEVQVFVVNESGASIYSASKIAREEFPSYDVTVRGAVSIGRRLMDPLAELVKIDPKSIGVGQYQHDVDQKKLADSLDQVVESCVNLVGVNVNTASKHLLTYVSGLGPQLAENIVEYRKNEGAFKNRTALKKVARMGDKAFEQAAGFLRISGGNQVLDNSAVHPESYPVVGKMAKDLHCSIEELMNSEEKRKLINLNAYLSEKTGMPTLKDIMQELAKPGRDPRNQIKVFEFSKDVFKIEDLIPGMELPGIVTNITNFGAFVDVGVKQDGLVHISQICDRFIKDPGEVLKLNQKVKVKVMEVDILRKRIQLSMKDVEN